MEPYLKSKLFEAIIEHSDDAIISKTLDGIVTSWNPAAEAMLGYTEGEMLGTPITALFQSDHEDEESIILARIKRGEKVAHFETVRLRKDGVPLDVSVTISPIRDIDGNIIGASKIVRDITQKKFLERQLAISREWFEAIVESSEDAIISKTLDGIVTSWNSAAETMFGYMAEEMLGQPITALFPPERRDEECRIIEKISRGEKVAHFETVRLRKDGVPLEVSATISPIRDPDGYIVGASKIVRDITLQKTLEKQLAASKEETEDLYNHAPCGYHSLNSEGVIININETELQWLGCKRDEVLGKIKFLDFITPASKNLFNASFPKYLETGFIKDLEFELIGKHGITRHVSVSATAVKDSHGKFLKSRTVLYDITELKTTQSALRQLTLEQQAMLNNELVGIVKLRKRRVLWVNKGMERLFDYAAGELDDQPSRIIYVDDSSYEKLAAEAYPILNTHGTFRTQIALLRKNGEIIWIDLSGTKLPNTIDESLWIMEDITASINYQQRIEQMAYHDILTGLPNRLLVNDRLQLALAHAKRFHQSVAVCYLDLDGFKAVNDKFGHVAGDRLLLETTKRMQAAVRANDTVGRLGGDEFVLLLTDLEDSDGYQLILQRVIDTINLPIPLDGSNEATVSASIGVALFPVDSSDADTLLKHADKAMYQAKKSGRNCICLYSGTDYN